MKTDRAEGEGREFALLWFVRDGLLECPNCRGDHFTTLRAPQKNLFSRALARLGRTGLVLTDLPPFIVASPADRQLAPAPAPKGPRGRADEIGKIRIGFEDNTGQRKHGGSGRRVRTKKKKKKRKRKKNTG